MSMQNRSESPQGSEFPRAARHRLVLAVVLLAGTVAAGTIVQRHDGPLASPATTPSVLTFQAPGGGPVDFRGQLDRSSVLAGGDGIVKMELVLRGAERSGPLEPRVPTDVVVVLDRSGSMKGHPLATAKAAVLELMARLEDSDRLALVSYASDVRMEWPLQRASGGRSEGWQTELARVRAGGGTHMAIGIDLANQVLAKADRSGRAARVILLSDGHANQGDHSLPGLRRRAARAVEGEWVFSTAGVGLGFDESLMAALADAGTGNFYYVREVENLAGVFNDEFASARETVASSLAVSIEPGDGVEVIDAAGYPLERDGSVVRFRPGDLFAGQERRIWVTLRAPASRQRERELGRFAVSYRGENGPEERAFSRTPRIACVSGEDDYYAGIDPEAWARSTLVDEIGELKQRVSRSVRSGDRDLALEQIRVYRQEKLRANAVLEREDVSAALRDLDAVEFEVSEAFAAPAGAAPALQNELRKELSAEGTDARRVGAKRR